MNAPGNSLKSFAIAAVVAVCLQIGASALGGHLCRGVKAFSQVGACPAACCADATGSSHKVTNHTSGGATAPLDSEDPRCCIDAPLVLMAPTVSCEIRPAEAAPHWMQSRWPTAKIDVPPPRPVRCDGGKPPRRPASLDVVRAIVFLI